MNKVKLEQHSSGDYSLTLPDGSQRPQLSREDVIKELKHKEEEFQAAIDDMKAVMRREYVNYEYVNYDEYVPDRGGPTPTYTFTVNGNILEFYASSDSTYGFQNGEPSFEREAVLELLKKRQGELQTELSSITALLQAAAATDKFVNHSSDEDNDDEED
jgi:hypothetical protein